MHVGVNINLERTHNQCNIWSSSGRVDIIVEGFSFHVRGVNGLQQFSTAYCCHTFINGEFKFPGTWLGCGVNTREPQPGKGQIIQVYMEKNQDFDGFMLID